LSRSLGVLGTVGTVDDDPADADMDMDSVVCVLLL